MSLEPKPRVDAPVPDSRDYAEEQENSVAPALNDRNLPHNPHRYSLQWVAVIVAAIVVFVMFRLGGVMIIAAGVFTFLDAWNAGIYKNKEKDSFLNISPAAWGIVVMGLLIVAYPAYALNRGKLKTMPGKQAYWYLTNVFGVLSLLLSVLPVLVAIVT